jgi:peptidoglycan/xylan/chitin deacetylase (PgdA/CDA1 family)
MARWLLSLLPRGPRRGSRLTIVRHHRVYAEGERPLYRLGVSAGVLELQLALFKSAGLSPLTVSEGLSRLAESRSGHWLALTFDDGYADNVERALPLLRKTGARATFYLTSGLIERRLPAWWDVLAHALENAVRPSVAWTAANGEILTLSLGSPAGRQAALRALLPGLRARPEHRDAALERLRQATGAAGSAPCEFATWAQAARLREAGMEIGAHTLTHPHLSLLTPAEQRLEIHGSAALITDRIGVVPSGFAYPGGDFDPASISAVRATRMTHAVTTRTGDPGPGADPWTLPRRGLSEGACLGPAGRFSRRMALAELSGTFDSLRGVEVGT